MYISDEEVIRSITDIRNDYEITERKQPVFEWTTVEYVSTPEEKTTEHDIPFDPCDRYRLIQKLAWFKKVEQLVQEGKISG